MSKVDDKITEFQAQVKAEFAKVGTSLDNVVQDEQALAKKIEDLLNQADSDLSAESQQKLADILADAQAMASRTQLIADSVPDSVSPPTV